MKAHFWGNRQRVCLASGVLAVACIACGRARAQDTDGTVSNQLALIAAACRDNTERVRTLQLSGTVVLRGRRYAGVRDPFTGQIYDSQTRDFSVWRDALAGSRLDVTADREADATTGEVNYNVPYGEHITSCGKLEREGGVDELARKYGTPQSTKRTIVTPSGTYRYEPEGNQLYLDDPAFSALDSELEMQVALNRMPDAGSGAELLERWAGSAERPGRSATLMALGGGQYHIRLAMDPVGGEGRAAHSYARDIVVDLDRGGNIVSYAAQTDGHVVETGQFDYMYVGGAWVIAHAEVLGGVGPDGVPMAKAVYDVQPESVQVNQPIDPQVFSFAGLDVRRGALVLDHKTGEQYLYDDVPLHVKVALAMEREREEDLAEAEARAAQSPPPIPVEEPAQKPQPSQAAPPAVGAAAPAERATSGPAKTVVVTPTSRAAPPPDTKPAHAPVGVRVVTTRPVPQEETVPPDNPPPSPPAARGPFVPSAAATAAVVSAGCAAALGIGIWKLTRRGTTPRTGS